MFELTFLGTSGQIATSQRGLVTSLIMYRGDRYLVDCAEETQRQLLSTPWGFRGTTNFLLTHGHSSHFVGLAGLFSTFYRWEVSDKFFIYGGKETIRVVKKLLLDVVLRGRKPNVTLEFIEVHEGLVLQNEGYKISAFPVLHGACPDSFGYSFEETSQRHFLADVANNLGIPAGPIRRDLVKGKPITLASGLTVYPDQVLGPIQQGTKLVYVGDTSDATSSSLIEVARNADALVIEATFLNNQVDRARKEGHITSSEAANLARVAEIQHLFLNHLFCKNSPHDYLDEAQDIFPNTTVPDDLDHYQIKHGEKPVKGSLSNKVNRFRAKKALQNK